MENTNTQKMVKTGDENLGNRISKANHHTPRCECKECVLTKQGFLPKPDGGEGCGNEFRASALTDELFVCGVNQLNGEAWLCDDCMIDSAPLFKGKPVSDEYLNRLNRIEGIVDSTDRYNLIASTRTIMKELKEDGFEKEDIVKYIISIVEKETN